MSSVAGWEFLTRQGVSEMCMFCFVVHILEPLGGKANKNEIKMGEAEEKGGNFLNPSC